MMHCLQARVAVMFFAIKHFDFHAISWCRRYCGYYEYHGYYHAHLTMPKWKKWLK